MRGYLLVFLAFFPVLAPAESVFRPGDVYTMCGDSITQQEIYSMDIEDYILMCQPVQGGCGRSSAAGAGRARTNFDPALRGIDPHRADAGYLQTAPKRRWRLPYSMMASARCGARKSGHNVGVT